MTKGGSSKPKTLGRLIFGEKRKQHASPARHRSSTRNGGSTADLSPSAPAAVPTTASKNSINLHDWAVWRMQLNEQMGAVLADGRSDLKQLRQFLQTNPFYQQYSRDSSTGRYNGVRLLFSIPHAKLKPEFLDVPRTIISKNTSNEVADAATYEQKKARSNSDDRTTTSVNSISTVQPVVIDKTISQLFPKSLVAHAGSFLQTNEQMIAADGMRTRRPARNSFTASDRIHSTLQKAVKDGNVLEKIKAFEMQAAAAQAESVMKIGVMNHRMQSMTASIHSAAHRTLSPGILHPIQHPISPILIQQQQQQQSTRSSRGRHIPPTHHRQDGTGHDSRKGAHVLEPAHGDVILKRRTPSQKTVNDEDYSITQISSIPLTAPQGHHHHRTSGSRSRHRQEIAHDKRAPSNNEILSHKNKQKATPTPSGKSSTRRRWLKGRKETPSQGGDKQEIQIIKSSKTSKNKKKNTEQEKSHSKKTSNSTQKEKLSSDNNRVYGVPNSNVIDQTKTESSSKIEEESESDPERDYNDNTNTYISPREDDVSQSKEYDTVIAKSIQRRPSKKHHQQKLSSTDGEILSKVDEDTRFSRPTDDHARRSTINDDDDKSEGDVFIEDPPLKPIPTIKRHQSVLNLPNNESCRFQQQSSNTIRRHASQCSADDCASSRRFHQSKEVTIKKKQLPLTLITRKNKINQDEQIVYEAPHSEKTQAPVCNSHTLKKKRPFHTINTAENSTNDGQNNNNKQISKQILHAIMNSMNNNQEQSTVPSPSTNDEFFENGPLTNPEETIANITASA